MSHRVEKLQADLDSALTPEQRIDTLNALAWELRDTDRARGLEYAQKAHELAQARDYQKGLADSFVSQSQYIYSDFTPALSHGYQALAIYEQLDDLIGQSRALYTLCWAHWFADNFIEAIEFGRRAQKLAQEVGDQALEADILNNLGLVYKRSGNQELAYKVYEGALALYRQLGDELRACKVLINMALAYILEGQFERALVLVNERLGVNLENPLIDGYTYLALGQISAGTKLYEDALDNLQKAVRIADDHDLEQLSQTALHAIGQLYLDQQQPGLAISHLQMALDQAIAIESNLSRYRCHEALAEIYEAQGDFAQALIHYRQFHTIKETLFNEKNMGRLQFLQIHHEAEIVRREVEIHRLKNSQLEQEIAERKRLQKKLYEQATTDVLTGISNRRHFMELAHREIRRARRSQHPFVLALIDLDHFKQVNDTYGHAAGDQVLISFARVCLENLREEDIFARFGGDEFVLLLPNTDSQQANSVVERLQQKLSENPLDMRGDLISITFSAGIARLANQQDTLDRLLQRADRALYQAKDAGKDRVAVDIPQ